MVLKASESTKMANKTRAVRLQDSSSIADNLKKTDTELDPRDKDGLKAIALPLFVFILICIVIAIIKSKHRRRKVGIAANEKPRTFEPSDNPINIRFKSLIGRGSFGVVWRAILDDVSVAVKICPVEKHERWEKERGILSYEAEHPNIVKMIDSEIRKIKEETALIIILEHVDNGDLRTFLMENTLNIDKALYLLRTLLEGLAFMHSFNCSYGNMKKAIVHRDMKSSNVLISSTKGCVIADFGLALSLNFKEKLAPQDAKSKVGTSRYMAPEKLTASISRSNQWKSLCLIDVYATALVAYEIMKRCSFQCDNAEAGEYIPEDFSVPFLEIVGPHPSNDQMKKVVVDDNVRPSIPLEWYKRKAMSDVGSLIVKCWDRNPTKRLTADKMLQKVKDVYLDHEMRPTYCAVELHSAGEEDSLLGDPIIELDCNASQAIIYSNNLNRSTYL
ncbi:activin receptor type-2B-like [Rhopilema esculentum]|uniref:activin receptor type-2B-like n=1 Tax=Rhopilema esculentum TaxID=499914 RepID=UPI0031E26255